MTKRDSHLPWNEPVLRGRERLMLKVPDYKHLVTIRRVERRESREPSVGLWDITHRLAVWVPVSDPTSWVNNPATEPGRRLVWTRPARLLAPSDRSWAGMWRGRERREDGGRRGHDCYKGVQLKNETFYHSGCWCTKEGRKRQGAIDGAKSERNPRWRLWRSRRLCYGSEITWESRRRWRGSRKSKPMKRQQETRSVTLHLFGGPVLPVLGWALPHTHTHALHRLPASLRHSPAEGSHFMPRAHYAPH